MKTGLVYFLVCLGFIAFLIFYNDPHHHETRLHRRTGPGRRLVLRKLSSEKHGPVAFDPIIANLERKREDRAWEREYFEQQYKRWNTSSLDQSGSTYSADASHSEPHPGDGQLGHHPQALHPESQPDPVSWEYMDPEDYLNNEEEFNISRRIMALFPLIDTSPPDGFITLAELEDWHLQAGLKQAEYRTDRQMEVYDRNHDQMISLSEFLSYVAPHQLENNTMDHGGSSWWKEQFNAADENGDGLLNHTEFNSFMHPEDSKNEKLRQLLCQQDIKNHDHDHDGKLSLADFSLGLFDILRNYDEEDHLLSFDSHEYARKRDAQARQKFTDLDKNKDGFLTEEELMSTMDRLHPGESFYAKQQAYYLMEQADGNKDGRLSIEEMLENPYVFYSTAYAHHDDEYLHDEFR